MAVVDKCWCSADFLRTNCGLVHPYGCRVWHATSGRYGIWGDERFGQGSVKASQSNSPSILMIGFSVLETLRVPTSGRSTYGM